MANVTFKKAVKTEAKLRMALAGPSGSGKTYSALAIATALAGEKGVAVLDTERGSASKYSDLFTFDVIELDTFHPDRYVEVIHAAEDAGYGVLVIDSLSHAWNGTGGLLEIVEAIAKRSKGGNTYAAWADATPIQNRLIDAITRARLHVILTMRSKQGYVLEKDERTGKTAPRKVGMAPIQRDGFEYEMDVFGEMDQDNTLVVQKSRCPQLASKIFSKPGAEVAAILADWLQGVPAMPVIPATANTSSPRHQRQPRQEAAPTPTPQPQPQKAQPAVSDDTALATDVEIGALKVKAKASGIGWHDVVVWIPEAFGGRTYTQITRAEARQAWRVLHETPDVITQGAPLPNAG